MKKYKLGVLFDVYEGRWGTFGLCSRTQMANDLVCPTLIFFLVFIKLQEQILVFIAV